MQRRLLAASIFLVAAAVVVAHGNNPPEYLGNWFGHRDAAYWADRENGLGSPEAIAAGHVVAAIIIGMPRPGLWVLAGLYGAIGALLWTMLIGANIAEVASAEIALVALLVPAGMVIAYIVIVVLLYRAVLTLPGRGDRVGSVSLASARPPEDERR